MDNELFERAKKMLTLQQPIHTEKIVEELKLFAPKAKIVVVDSFDTLALDIARARARDLDIARALARARARDLDLARALDLALDLARARARARARALARDLALQWLFIDCHYEALSVLGNFEDIEEYNKWMHFFVACENGLNCVCLGENNLYAIVNPGIILLDDNGKFHSDHSAAIEWLDKKLYYWHGVPVPERSILNIGSYSKREIMQQKNTEVRRALMAMYGWDKFIDGARLIDKHTEPMIGELYAIDDEYQELRILKCLNGTANPDSSMKWVYLWVPSNLNTALDANRWTYPDLANVPDDVYLAMQAART